MSAFWKVGVAIAAFLVTSTAIYAQPPTTSIQLGRPLELPLIQFNHFTTIHLDNNGELTITGGEATNIIRQLAPGQSWSDFILRVIAEVPKNANGTCPRVDATGHAIFDGTGEPTEDLRANGNCQQISTNNLGSIAFGKLTMKVKIDTSPDADGGTSLPGVSSDACGVAGGSDNFCVMGEVFHCSNGQFPTSCEGATASSPFGPFLGPSGILVRGKIRTAQDLGVQTSMALVHNFDSMNPHFGHIDIFEYVFQPTGGTLFDKGLYQPAAGIDPTPLFDVEIVGLRELLDGAGNVTGIPNPTALVLPPPPAMFADWTQPFTEVLAGTVAKTNYGSQMLGCRSQISGSVTDYFNPAAGITGAEVSVTGGPTLQANIATLANGSYTSVATMCAGVYLVTALPPSGAVIYGDATRTVTLTGMTGVTGVNFQMYTSPINTGAFTTFGQGPYGTKPKGQNAGMLLKTYFDFLYPAGELEIGTPDTVGRYSITVTGSEAIMNFLPQEGLPRPLTASYVDPPSRWKLKHARKYNYHRRLGALAGETMALELNVRFSAFNLTKNGLGSMKVVSGKLMGWSVDQVLAAGNVALGGGPLPAVIGTCTPKNYLADLLCNYQRYDALEDIIERINKNYQAGTVDRGFLAAAVPVPVVP